MNERPKKQKHIQKRQQNSTHRANTCSKFIILALPTWLFVNENNVIILNLINWKLEKFCVKRLYCWLETGISSLNRPASKSVH